ncbi:MAG: NADH-quinone oxidoreductase subunit C [Steroidobacteraceae bacterium]
MTAHIEQLATRIAERLGERVRRYASLPGELSYEVAPAELIAIATLLRDDPALRFEILIDAAGVDYLDYGKVEWTALSATNSGFSRGASRTTAHPLKEGSARFAVVYQLLSVTHNERVRLKVWCEGAEDPVVDSLCGVWASANWFEREAFDLFGIYFKGHPDLRRILTDYGFIGHPFRKDFPLSGHVEVRYDANQGRVIYEPVDIEPRTLVPRVIRADNRYDPALLNAPMAPAAAPAPVKGAAGNG